MHASRPRYTNVYGAVGSDAAQLVDYPLSNGVPDISNPTVTETGTISVPTDFASMQGYTFDSCGHILVSGDTSSNEEQLTELGGFTALGYRCGDDARIGR